MQAHRLTANIITYNGKHRAPSYNAAWDECWNAAQARLVPDLELATALSRALKKWGMGWAGVEPPEAILPLLLKAWKPLQELNGVDVPALSPQHKAAVTEAYEVLRGVTRSASVAAGSKALLLLWGGTPAFDSKVRKHARKSFGPDGAPLWPHRQTLAHLDGEEYWHVLWAFAEAYRACTTLASQRPTTGTHGRLLDMALHAGPV